MIDVEYQTWRIDLERQRRQAEKPFDRIYSLMTVAEREQYFLLNCDGIWDSKTNTVMMKPEAMDRFLQFRIKMKDKYALS